MPVYQLGNGDNYFASATKPDFTNDSSVFGGNGNDTIIVSAVSPFSTSHLFVEGGNGNDTIRLDAQNSVAFGGNGNDTITSIGGLGNTLIGGNGDDTLISVGGGSGMGPGNTLTGGLGHDTFELINDGNLVVTNDAAAGNGVVSDRDVFKGPMDVITDLHRGDHIGLRNYDVHTNDITGTDIPVARVDSVTLALDPLQHTGDSFRPVIGSAQYAVFHGTFAGGNTFTVGADGPDLLAVYDTRTGPTELVGKGSLVLQGVTDERLLDEALSPSTVAGGGWYYSEQAGGGVSFNESAGSGSAASAVMPEKPADGTGAMGVMPT